MNRYPTGPPQTPPATPKTTIAAAVIRQWRWFVVIGFPIAFGIVAYVLVRHQPQFYVERAFGRTATEQTRLSNEFVAKAAKFLGEIQGNSTWMVSFDEAQVNGWLAVDFEKNHARQILPSDIKSPRVVIEGDRIRLGFRFKKGPLESIVQIALRAWVPRRDTIALELDRAWCGAFPLPMTYTQHIIESFAQARSMNVTWKRHKQRLVAMIEMPRDQRDLVLRRVDIRDGMIRLKGASGRFTLPGQDYAPSAN